MEDLGQLAKIEDENLVLNKTRTDLLEIVRTVSDTMKGEISKKNLTISIGGSPVFAQADKNRFSQVIANLLSNAVKYTPEGGVIGIVVSETDRLGIVKIMDSGIGISEKELPFIFERFYRTDKSRNRKSGGAGIGLAIVKSIVEAHGGTVTAESVEEQGSSFTVSIPKEG